MSTLVIILCETRAHRITGELFMKNVKQSLNADLALCVRDDEEPNIFYENAEYIWKFKEPENYLEEFDKIAGHKDWHKAYEIGNTWLGAGNAKSIPKQDGSAAILYYYRWLLINKLREENLIQKYDWFIVTRSDFMWLMPHCPTDLMKPGVFHFPYGQFYDGITDRHHIIPSNYLEECLESPLKLILFNTDEVLELIDECYKGTKYINAEMYLRILYIKKYELKYKFLPYVMFTVREKDGPTSWSTGNYNEKLGCIIKYDTEFTIANEFLEIAKESPRFWEISLTKNMTNVQKTLNKELDIL